MLGVLCVIMCLAAALKQPIIGGLGGLTYLGFVGYIIYTFWNGAWPILQTESKTEYPDDPGFPTFILWAMLWINIVGQACAACMCCMFCCALAVGGTAVLGQLKGKMGGSDDAYAQYN